MAKHPFQFLAKIHGLHSNNIDILVNIPITQDASASAYQIMSYFMLDEKMAERTNLIPSDAIQDIYSFFLDELKEFLILEQSDVNKSLFNSVIKVLDRKIVKKIFMPIIYGKTIMSTANDLEKSIYHYITKKDSFELAKACFKFWKMRYPGIECLMQLIRHIGWIAAAGNRPVFYKVPLFTTVQDYMIMEPINIWVYDRNLKKRRQITMRVATSKRDRNKTISSTFANLIHQRDAYIAIEVVNSVLSFHNPIYTVHDNFISTPSFCGRIPSLYINAFRGLGPPLSIINNFIYKNLFKHIDQLLGNSDRSYNNMYYIIPRDELTFYLNKNIPNKISKTMKKSWEERISGILNAYETYVSHVSRQSSTSTKTELQKCWDEHQKRWYKFQYRTIPFEDKPHYCVHC